MNLEKDVMDLRAENDRLHGQLAQATADKDFVWSLWKRLQVSSPDISQAISLVVQREKEKSTAKDEKVLWLLQMKDAKVGELQTLVTNQSKELAAVIQQKSDLLDKTKRLEADCIALADRNQSVEQQLRSQVSRDEDYHRLVTAYEQEQSGLTERVSQLQAALTKAKSDRGDRMAEIARMQARIQMLESELNEKMPLQIQLISTAEESRRTIGELESELNRVRNEGAQRQREAESRRAELEREVAELRKGQGLRSVDIKLVAECQNLRSKLSDCEREYSAPGLVAVRPGRLLRNTLLPRQRSQSGVDSAGDVSDSDSDVIAEQHRGRQRRRPRSADARANVDQVVEEDEEEGGNSDYSRVTSPVVDLAYKVDRLGKQVHLIQDCLTNRQEISRLVTPREPRASSEPGRSVQPPLARKCPPASNDALRRKVTYLTIKLERMETTLKDKITEFNLLQEAHTKCVKKLKTLQAECKTSRHQISELKAADSNWRSEETGRKEVIGQWKQKCAALEEELSSLRMQATKDAAKMRDLLISLEQVKEDFEMKTSQLESGAHLATLEQYKHRVETLQSEMDALQRQHKRSDNIWESENRGLKAELQSLAEELSQKRIELSELQKIHPRPNPAIGVSDSLIDSSRSVHGSNHVMASILHHFSSQPVLAQQSNSCCVPSVGVSAPTVGDQGGAPHTLGVGEDQWEDVESGMEDPHTGRSSLGARIARLAKHHHGPVSGTVPAGKRHHRPIHLVTGTWRRRHATAGHRCHQTRDDGPEQGEGGDDIEFTQPVPPAALLRGRIASLQQQLRASKQARGRAEGLVATAQAQLVVLTGALEQAKARNMRLREALQSLTIELGALRERNRLVACLKVGESGNCLAAAAGMPAPQSR